MPFGRVAPAERSVVFGERAGRRQLAVVAAVDDLVDVAEGDVLRRRRRASASIRTCSMAPVPASQWVRIGAPVLRWAAAAAAKTRAVAC